MVDWKKIIDDYVPFSEPTMFYSYPKAYRKTKKYLVFTPIFTILYVLMAASFNHTGPLSLLSIICITPWLILFISIGISFWKACSYYTKGKRNEESQKLIVQMADKRREHIQPSPETIIMKKYSRNIKTLLIALLCANAVAAFIVFVVSPLEHFLVTAVVVGVIFSLVTFWLWFLCNPHLGKIIINQKERIITIQWQNASLDKKEEVNLSFEKISLLFDFSPTAWRFEAILPNLNSHIDQSENENLRWRIFAIDNNGEKYLLETSYSEVKLLKKAIMLSGIIGCDLKINYDNFFI